MKQRRSVLLAGTMAVSILVVLLFLFLLLQPSITGIIHAPTTMPAQESVPVVSAAPAETTARIPTPTSAPMQSITALPTPAPRPVPDKVAYLTFDDGPSELTVEVTRILSKYDIKATFFVINRTDERSREILRNTAELGHTIGMHGATHNYNVIYDSAEAFNHDLDLNYAFILETTGIPPTIFRFPGGSVNRSNAEHRIEIIRSTAERGYVYFDWNCSSGDGNYEPQDPDVILGNVLRTARDPNRIIVIMHDSVSKTTTITALPKVIEALAEREIGRAHV